VREAETEAENKGRIGRRVGLAAGAAALVVAVVMAFRLDVFGRTSDASSPCRRVLTAADQEALAIPMFEVASVEDAPAHCWLAGADTKGEQGVVVVEMGGDLGGPAFESGVTLLGGARRTFAAGDEGVVVTRDRESVIAVRVRHAGLFVHLAAPLYDEAAVRRVEAHVAARAALLEPYANRWTFEHGNDR
jgi:hypothetical protein